MGKEVGRKRKKNEWEKEMGKTKKKKDNGVGKRSGKSERKGKLRGKMEYKKQGGGGKEN